MRAILDSLRSMRGILRDRTFPLERRREVLRRFLPTRDGQRPIRVEFDLTAKRGWQNALRRVTVRHLTTRTEGVRQARLVAGAVTVEAGQLESPGWDAIRGLPTWERELVPGDLVAALDAEVVGMGAGPGSEGCW